MGAPPTDASVSGLAPSRELGELGEMDPNGHLVVVVQALRVVLSRLKMSSDSAMAGVKHHSRPW